MSALDKVAAAPVGWSAFNSRTITITSVTAGASIFVINPMGNFAGSSIGAATVNDGSAYVLDAVHLNPRSGAPLTVEVWRLHNVSAGTHNIVLTSSNANNNNYGDIFAFSVTGLQNAAPDVTPAGAHASSTTPATGSTGTLSQSGEFVIAAMILDTAVGSPAFTSPATTGYTSLMNVQATGNFPASADYKTVSATTGVSAAWGTIAGSENWSAVVVAYKDVVAGGAPTITSIIQSGQPAGTIQQGASITITGTNFGTNTGSAAVTLIDGGNSSLSANCAVTSWGSTSIVCTVTSGNVRNGALTTRVTTSGGLQVSLGATLTPPTGTAFGTFGTLRALTFDSNTTPSRLYDSPDIGNVEQWEIATSAGSGTATVYQDGNIDTPTAITQIAFRHHNGTAWSSVSHWDMHGLAPKNVLTIPAQAAVNGTTVSWDITGFFQEADASTLPFTYTISAGILPSPLTLNASTGKITGTVSGTGTFSGIVVRAANAEGLYAEAPAFTATISASANVSFSGTVSNVTLVANSGANPIDVAPFFTNATTYAVTSGALPDGTVLNGSAIVGTPTGLGINPGASANYPIVITGSNSVPSSAPSNSFTITVSNPVTQASTSVVPNVAGSTTQATAVAALTAAGLLPQVPQPWTGTQTIMQSVTPGSVVPIGTPVYLFIPGGNVPPRRRLKTQQSEQPYKLRRPLKGRR